jgi:poly-gamma-glutamate capsule biosynthesis protein CapA/YwtB (metallophosphatase superfamily)
MTSKYRRRDDARLATKTRRDFLKLTGIIAAAVKMAAAHPEAGRQDERPAQGLADRMPLRSSSREITLFLCGDLMTGRGIDQILPHPSDPQLYESYMTSAEGYVKLAEKVNGPIPQPADFGYPWGDALDEFRHINPDVRIINLETAVTAASDPWPGKGIHYRMHPKNLPCLTSAKIDCAVLANNHTLDWGYAGLKETLAALAGAHIKTTGAGRSRRFAEAPAVIKAAGKGRVLVFGLGDRSSGIPWLWDARGDRPGVNLLPDLSENSVLRLAGQIAVLKQQGDCIVASIHWGGNWGYEIPEAHRKFAHRLIDEARVDVVHGHSSHHPLGIELYQGKPIFYGCGDFLNDYEGIPGHTEFRSDLSIMYFVTLDLATGKLVRLIMAPMQIKRFRLNVPLPEDIRWLRQVLDRESRPLGTKIELADHGRCLVLSAAA